MPPKPLFYIVRPGLERITTDGELIIEPGALVPLIPVDLLSPRVAIEGVPHNLTREQAIGMMNLGSFHRESEGYQVILLQNEDAVQQQEDPVEDDTDTSTASVSEPSDTSLQQRSQVDEVTTSPPPQKTPPPRMLQGLASSRHNPLNNMQTPSPPPLRLSTPKPRLSTNPQYCRHWCHHGTCKWGITCRFEHTMPTTLDGLCSVGLPDIPNWWRAVMAHGVQSGGGLTVKKTGKKKRYKRLQMESLRMSAEGHGYGHGHGHGSGDNHRPAVGHSEGEEEDADDEREATVTSVTEENLIDV